MLMLTLYKMGAMYGAGDAFQTTGLAPMLIYLIFYFVVFLIACFTGVFDSMRM